jgi:tetratricopeptide (TPR) repeat protein
MKTSTKKINNSFFIFSSLSVVGEFRSLSAGLLQAYFLRDYKRQVELAGRLMDFPAPFRDRGAYHLAMNLARGGRGDLDKAGTVLTRLAGSSDPSLVSNSLIALSGIASINGQEDESLDLLRLAMDAGRSPFSIAQAQTALSLALSEQGEHAEALRVLMGIEGAVRMIGTAFPVYLADYYNSLAVELGQSGKVTEALHFSNLALAHQDKVIYPEWVETNREIKALFPQNLSSSVTFSFPVWLPPDERIMYEKKRERERKVRYLQPSPLLTDHSHGTAKLFRFPSKESSEEAVKISIGVKLIWKGALLRLCCLDTVSIESGKAFIDSLETLSTCAPSSTFLRVLVDKEYFKEIPVHLQSLNRLGGLLGNAERTERIRDRQILDPQDAFPCLLAASK